MRCRKETGTQERIKPDVQFHIRAMTFNIVVEFQVSAQKLYKHKMNVFSNGLMSSRQKEDLRLHTKLFHIFDLFEKTEQPYFY